MFPTTAERVPRSTAPELNEQIRRQTDETVSNFQGASAERIQRRLEALDREWDIERTLEANAAAVALAGLGLGAMVDRRLLVLPALVATFLLQHAVQGWCPPLPLFRRLGVRTQSEIDEERYALKALRGDFVGVNDAGAQEHKRVPLGRLMAAVRR
jgi:hypothetical protein